MEQSALDTLCINSLRFLAVDMVQHANSGHPGLPMGAAPMAYVLWTRFLRHAPHDPDWFNRDRFVLSAGHGSALLYALLYSTGYDLPLEELKRFRQLRSATPGHPERNVAAGVETTTGPLGQGFGNAVGMAVAQAHLAARFNRPGHQIIDHDTYALVSDGDLMEGVGSEAASLAGHWRLRNLVCLYDDNRVMLAGSTDLSFTEDRRRRFEAYGWSVAEVADGNDLEAIEGAISRVKSSERPGLVIVRTHIGYGSPSKHDTFQVHGSPLGDDEVIASKRNMGFPETPTFHVPSEALTYLRMAVERGKKLVEEWQKKWRAYQSEYPALAQELQGMIAGELPKDWDRDLPSFPADDKGMATRKASGKVLTELAKRIPSLIGGSADLNPSTNTALAGMGDFERPGFEGDAQGSAGGGANYAGRNLHFGVREHGMGSILNGIACHGGLIPYGATFLVFSDYMRPTIRLAALMSARVIYVFTHDSIGLGEDGPTHQPVEHLASLRAIPGLVVIRPGDANETAEAWRVAIAMRRRPVALVLTRQSVPVFDRAQRGSAEGVQRGAYVLEDSSLPTRSIILIATGSEVSVALGAKRLLERDGIGARVVSMPSWELFEEQDQGWKDSVLPPNERVRIAIEAGSPMGWERYVGDSGQVIGVETFGESAPGKEVLRDRGFTPENVAARARELVDRYVDTRQL